MPTPLSITALAFVSNPLVLPFNQTLPQAQVQATFSDASTEIINWDLRYPLTWTSSNTSVASFIDGRGMMYFSQSGVSTLTVASGAIAATTALTVTPLLVAITITGLRRVLVGQTLQLQLTGTYDDGTTGAITAAAAWIVGSPSILAVNSTGLISAQASGTSAVSVTFSGLSTSFYVNVPSVASTDLVVPAGALPGQTAQFVLIQTYSDGSTQDITSSASWFTSSAAIATISNAGLLTCVSSGTVTVGEYQAGQITQSVSYTVLAPSLTSISVTTPAVTLIAGQTIQLVATGAYTGGNSSNLTGQVTWRSANLNASVSSTGLVTGLTAGLAVLIATFNGFQGSVNLNVFAAPDPNLQPQFLSHTTQVMLNYFDRTDVRVREGKYSIDAQLLNVAAQELEMSDTRFNREIKSKTLTDCPANIDNKGVYFQQVLPLSFDFTVAHAVQATINSTLTTLSLYNDLLPVPVAVVADARFTPLPLSAPQVFSVSGAGDPVAQTWATQRVENPPVSMSGRINLWMFGTGFNQVQVMVRITGQRSPAPAWASRQAITSETIKLTKFGAARSKFAWASITEIQVSGLPIGVTISGQIGTFGASYVADASRPYTDPSARDVLYDRYWTYQDGMLQEQYLASNHSGFRYIQSYASAPVNGIAVEPNTYGLWVAQGTTLLYIDRREPLPTNLNATALTAEPYYGVKVSIDEMQTGPLRAVVLEPVPYGQSDQVTQYRYLLQAPNGTTYALTPDGVYATLTPIAGWRRGAPLSLTLPLAQIGTYVITLQCVGNSNVALADATPYTNLALAPKAQFDLSSIVSSIEGLSFDDRGRLWVWTGTSAIALAMQHNAYTLDASTQAIYLTDTVQGLIIDGVTI